MVSSYTAAAAEISILYYATFHKLLENLASKLDHSQKLIECSLFYQKLTANLGSIGSVLFKIRRHEKVDDNFIAQI